MFRLGKRRLWRLPHRGDDNRRRSSRRVEKSNGRESIDGSLCWTVSVGQSLLDSLYLDAEGYKKVVLRKISIGVGVGKDRIYLGSSPTVRSKTERTSVIEAQDIE